MNRLALFGVAALALAAVATDGYAQGQSADKRPARVTRARSGAALSLPSTASARAIIAQFLRDQGRDNATATSLATIAEGQTKRGLRIARFEQRVGGLPVWGSYAKVALNNRGELVSIIENIADVRGNVRAAQVSASQAIRAAVQNLYPTLAESPAGFFHRAPAATRVAVPQADGSMSEGFLVETWTEATNQLHYTLVEGTGRIADVESRTNDDSYRVFRVYPGFSPQEIVTGPAANPAAPSPQGWLFSGTHTTQSISGNNVHAYVDAVSDNAPDGGGANVVDGNFLDQADLTQQPSIEQNRNVAVQNLFYFNNVLHDELYRHGFDELAGNFQETNFTGQGLDGDSVNAEAQDGGGIDNANFATPNDGSNPRMQMYLWSGLGTHRVEVNGTSYLAQGAAWGGTLTTTGVTGAVAVVNDGAGVSVSDACERLPRNSLSGKVAVADRGNCDFTVKAGNVQTAGAVAIVIANNVDGPIFTMGGSAGGLKIAGVMVSKADGTAIKAAADANAKVKLADTPPLSFDGDVDSDIVYHEYGHGLTWRMIGGMSGPLAGAIGEGMSDVLAVIFNNNDIVGEYSTGDFTVGIRRNAYNNYPRTYADVNGAEVHDDGEVYGAIGWRLWKNFEGAGVSKDTVLDYIVDGMNFTPSTPDYEAMRDGILTAIKSAQGSAVPSPSLHECLVWDAFADYGVGLLADGSVKGKRVTIKADSTVPSTCSRVP